MNVQIQEAKEAKMLKAQKETKGKYFQCMHVPGKAAIALGLWSRTLLGIWSTIHPCLCVQRINHIPKNFSMWILWGKLNEPVKQERLIREAK